MKILDVVSPGAIKWSIYAGHGMSVLNITYIPQLWHILHARMPPARHYLKKHGYHTIAKIESSFKNFKFYELSMVPAL